MIGIKDASLRAIDYVVEMELLDNEASPEGYRASAHVAVEDARHDAESGTWTIGVGFVRPWDRLAEPGALASLLPNSSLSERRTVKHVRLDDDTGELMEYY